MLVSGLMEGGGVSGQVQNRCRWRESLTALILILGSTTAPSKGGSGDDKEMAAGERFAVASYCGRCELVRSVGYPLLRRFIQHRDLQDSTRDSCKITLDTWYRVIFR